MWRKKDPLVLLSVAVVALLLLVPARALAQAPPPHRFGGTANLDGKAVAAGVTVTALIDGQTVAIATTTAGGNYIIDVVQPQGASYAGRTVTFIVGGGAATQTATWTLGGATVLNLTALSAAAPAISPTTPELPDLKTPAMIININLSFMRAFGRDPTEGETARWLDVLRKDQGLNNVNYLVAQHRQLLESDAKEREATVRRAFTRLGPRPPPGRFELWENRYSLRGIIYENMLPHILINESYWEAFGRWPDTEWGLGRDEYANWRNHPSVKDLDFYAVMQTHRNNLADKYDAHKYDNEREAVVRRVFTRLFGQQPTQGQINNWSGIVQSQLLTYTELQPRILISESYWQAFGRYPTGEEETYWKSDSRVINLDFKAVMQTHRNWLRDNARERELTVGRAFTSVLGHAPTQGQLDNLVRVPETQRLTYTELQPRILIFESYWQAFGRDPTGEEDAYWVTDSRVKDLRFQAVMENHRNHLRDNARERNFTVGRAFTSVLGQPPTPGQINTWSGIVQSQLYIYTELQPRILISESYQQAFGRDPTDGETGQWLSALRKDQGLNNIAALVGLLRDHLAMEENVQEREGVVQRAFTRVGYQPPAGHFQNWVSEGSVGRIYVELLGLFRKVMIPESFQQALGRDPSEAELRSWLRVSTDDPRLRNLDTLVDELRTILANPTEQRGMIRRVYVKLFGQDPTEGKVERRIGTVQGKYLTYTEQLPRILVDESYLDAFGRSPFEAEVAYWLTDPRVKGLHFNMVMQNHRDHLERDATEREATIRRAFSSVIGREPTAEEMTSWRGIVASEPRMFEELPLWYLLYADLQPRILVLESYQQAFGRSASKDELYYWLTDPRVKALASDKVMQNHRNHLKGDATEREATIGRAFPEAVGTAYASLSKLEKEALNGWLESAVNEVQTNAPLFKDLGWHIRVDTAFRFILGRAPSGDELGLWKSKFGFVCDMDCETVRLKAWSFYNVAEELRTDLQARARTDYGRGVVENAAKRAFRPTDWSGTVSVTYPDMIGEVVNDVADKGLTNRGILLDFWVRVAYDQVFREKPNFWSLWRPKPPINLPPGELAWWLALPANDPRSGSYSQVLASYQTYRDIRNAIDEGYRRAYGREATPSEVTSLTTHLKKNPPSSPLKVVEKLSEELRSSSNGKLREEVIVRAFAAATPGITLKPGEAPVTWWANWVEGNGRTYEELVRMLRGETGELRTPYFHADPPAGLGAVTGYAATPRSDRMGSVCCQFVTKDLEAPVRQVSGRAWKWQYYAILSWRQVSKDFWTDDHGFVDLSDFLADANGSDFKVELWAANPVVKMANGRKGGSLYKRELPIDKDRRTITIDDEYWAFNIANRLYGAYDQVTSFLGDVGGRARAAFPIHTNWGHNLPIPSMGLPLPARVEVVIQDQGQPGYPLDYLQSDPVLREELCHAIHFAAIDKNTELMTYYTSWAAWTVAPEWLKEKLGAQPSSFDGWLDPPFAPEPRPRSGQGTLVPRDRTIWPGIENQKDLDQATQAAHGPSLLTSEVVAYVEALGRLCAIADVGANPIGEGLERLRLDLQKWEKKDWVPAYIFPGIGQFDTLMPADKVIRSEGHLAVLLFADFPREAGLSVADVYRVMIESQALSFRQLARWIQANRLVSMNPGLTRAAARHNIDLDALLR